MFLNRQEILKNDCAGPQCVLEEERVFVCVCVDLCSAIGNALLAGSGGEKPGRKRQ